MTIGSYAHLAVLDKNLKIIDMDLHLGVSQLGVGAHSRGLRLLS